MSDLSGADLFVNRELSWLAFNRRVLELALDESVPLLERLKFLAIVSANLDEFYMVRVAGLRRQVAAGVTTVPADGMTPQEQLEAIRQVVAGDRARHRDGFRAVMRALEAHGVRLVQVADLAPAEWAGIDAYFETQVFPVLTPLAFDPGHPFPYISNLSLSLAVEMRDPERDGVHFARVKVPKSLPRWVPVPGRPNHFVPLEQVIGANVAALFPGMEVLGWHAFRITRYSDLELPVDEPEDLLATIEAEVFNRRFGEVVRLEVESAMPQHLRTLLLEHLQERTDVVLPLTDGDLHEAGEVLDLGDLAALHAIDLPELKDPPFTPAIPPELADATRSIFDVIRERDILVHHPFDSFPASVERFLDAAAQDDNVLAIKVTLYRTSGDTAIVAALTEAAQRGKQVAVMVELKARFDETNNISWGRTLENFGVHVSYGSASLKIHAKIALVVRREADGIRRYVHLGTGNYNSRTARLYTDVGLFTCNPSLGADVSDLFNSLTGFSRQRLYRKLVVAPVNMRDRILELVEREAGHARAGRPAAIVAKMNALVDPAVIHALYRAARDGVSIDLIVRGICCLRPGVAGVSDRIHVRSIVGRFLEHSRIWSFANGRDPELFIGSADWMPRNFERRVEAVTPVEDPVSRQRLGRVLATLLRDDTQAWELGADGRWTRRVPAGEPFVAHTVFLADSWGAPAADPGALSEARSHPAPRA